MHCRHDIFFCLLCGTLLSAIKDSFIMRSFITIIIIIIVKIDFNDLTSLYKIISHLHTYLYIICRTSYKYTCIFFMKAYLKLLTLLYIRDYIIINVLQFVYLLTYFIYLLYLSHILNKKNSSTMHEVRVMK